jgi:hypothetical protein
MLDEKIESLLAGAGAEFERASQTSWKLRLGPERKIQATLACVKASLMKDCDVLKVFIPVGKLPKDAGIDFFKDIFRKNRDLGHGGFALAGEENVVFVDTLQLANCDQNEMNATLDWLIKSIDIFKEKLDRSKLPYLEAL